MGGACDEGNRGPARGGSVERVERDDRRPGVCENQTMCDGGRESDSLHAGEGTASCHRHRDQAGGGGAGPQLPIVIIPPGETLTVGGDGEGVGVTRRDGGKRLAGECSVGIDSRWHPAVGGVADAELAAIIGTPAKRLAIGCQGQIMPTGGDCGHGFAGERSGHVDRSRSPAVKRCGGVAQFPLVIIPPSEKFAVGSDGQTLVATGRNGHEAASRKFFGGKDCHGRKACAIGEAIAQLAGI